MKRSEALDHIKEELEEFITIYNISSDAAKPYKIKSASDKILSMLEGFGMEAPHTGLIKEIDIIDRWSIDTGKKEYTRLIVNEWEPENE